MHLILIPEENPIANESNGNTAVILSVLLCSSGKIPQNPYTKLSGAKYALTSYGGTQSHPPASISGDGIFAGTGPAITTPPTVQHGLVRIRDVIDGTSSTILFGGRSHFDPNYDTFFASGYTQNPMAGWGYWAPAGGQLGLTDLTMSSYVTVNHRMPFNFPNRPGSIPVQRHLTPLRSRYDECARSAASTLAERSSPSLMEALASSARALTVSCCDLSRHVRGAKWWESFRPVAPEGVDPKYDTFGVGRY